MLGTRRLLSLILVHRMLSGNAPAYPPSQRLTGPGCDSMQRTTHSPGPPPPPLQLPTQTSWVMPMSARVMDQPGGTVFYWCPPCFRSLHFSTIPRKTPQHEVKASRGQLYASCPFSFCNSFSKFLFILERERDIHFLFHLFMHSLLIPAWESNP